RGFAAARRDGGTSPLKASAQCRGFILLTALAIVRIAAAEEEAEHSPPPESQALLDRTQNGVHSAVSRTARRIDSIFGDDEADPSLYDRASGSVAPALLWDEFDGFSTRFRFRVDLPLPQIDERFDAFIGRVNR